MKSDRPTLATHENDVGATLIEILISIVLLGTVMTATLTGLTTTISASAIDRDHANGHAWLQTGADVLYARELRQCSLTAPAATEMAATIAEYQATVQQTKNPEGWAPGNMRVVALQWWRIDIAPNGLGSEGWGAVCDSGDTNLQRVTLQVTGKDGRIVESVEVIIGG